VLFTTMSVIWGVPYLLIKVADRGVSVPVLVFARVAIGAAVLLPIAIRRGQIRVLAPHWRWLATFAVVEIMVPWALLSDAERHLSSSMSGLLIASVPIIGLVLARVTGGTERLTVVRWAGLLAGLGGVGLLAGPRVLGGGALPITEVLLTALCYATGPLIANRKLSGLPGLGMTAVCLGAAAIVYAPVAALTWPASTPSAAVLGSLAGLGVLCTAIAFVVFFQLIEEVGPARATVITYVNPAVAVALGVAVLGEPLTPTILAAFVLILAGSVLATRSGQPAGKAPEPAPEQAPGAVPEMITEQAGGRVSRKARQAARQPAPDGPAAGIRPVATHCARLDSPE